MGSDKCYRLPQWMPPPSSRFAVTGKLKLLFPGVFATKTLSPAMQVGEEVAASSAGRIYLLGQLWQRFWNQSVRGDTGMGILSG